MSPGVLIELVINQRLFAGVSNLLRLDPLVDGGTFEAPMGTNLKAGQFAAGSVLVDRQRLHAEVLRQLLDCKNAFFSTQG